MGYYYVRFEDVFQFGQAYQLTVTDQSHYGDLKYTFSQMNMAAFINRLIYNFIKANPLFEAFPYFIHNGILVNFPILLFTGVGLFSEDVWPELKKQQMWGFIITLLLIPLVIMRGVLLQK